LGLISRARTRSSAQGPAAGRSGISEVFPGPRLRPSRRTLEPLEAQRQPVAIRAILDAARYMDAPPFSRFRASSIGPSFNAKPSALDRHLCSRSDSAPSCNARPAIGGSIRQQAVCPRHALPGCVTIRNCFLWSEVALAGVCERKGFGIAGSAYSQRAHQ
jgi:hypothetical protein